MVHTSSASCHSEWVATPSFAQELYTSTSVTHACTTIQSLWLLKGVIVANEVITGIIQDRDFIVPGSRKGTK
jgi:exosortase/archaeosortase